MKMHRYAIVIVALFAVILLAGCTQNHDYKIRGPLKEGQTNEESQFAKPLESTRQMHSIKELKEVVVKVVGSFRDCESMGGRIFIAFDESDGWVQHVRRQVETRLVQNGLSVLPNQYIHPSKDTRPHFVVTLNLNEQPNCLSIEVTTLLWQGVILKDDTSIRSDAIKWKRTSTQSQGTGDLQSDVSLIVEGHLDSFIKDYLDVNPKQIPKDK